MNEQREIDLTSRGLLVKLAIFSSIVDVLVVVCVFLALTTQLVVGQTTRRPSGKGASKKVATEGQTEIEQRKFALVRQVRLKTKDWTASALAFSPDGSKLLLGLTMAAAMDRGSTLAVADVASGRIDWTFDRTGDDTWNGHLFDGSVQAIAFSPDGSRVALSIGYGGAVRLWDAKSGILVHTFSDGEESAMKDLRFTADGRLLIGAGSTGADETEKGIIMIWRVSDGRLIKTLDLGLGSEIGVNISVSPDSMKLAGVFQSKGEMPEIRIWNLRTFSNELLGRQSGCNSLAFTADSQSLISASADSQNIQNSRGEWSFKNLGGQIQLWNIGTGQANVIVNSSEGFSEMKLAENGQLLAVLTPNRNSTKLIMWDPNTGDLKGTILGAASFAISSDGQMVATSDWGQNVKIWRRSK